MRKSSSALRRTTASGPTTRCPARRSTDCPSASKQKPHTPIWAFRHACSGTISALSSPSALTSPMSPFRHSRSGYRSQPNPEAAPNEREARAVGKAGPARATRTPPLVARCASRPIRSQCREAVGEFPGSDDFLYINDKKSILRWGHFGLGTSASAACRAPGRSPQNAVVTFVQPLGILRQPRDKAVVWTPTHGQPLLVGWGRRRHVARDRSRREADGLPSFAVRWLGPSGTKPRSGETDVEARGPRPSVIAFGPCAVGGLSRGGAPRRICAIERILTGRGPNRRNLRDHADGRVCNSSRDRTPGAHEAPRAGHGPADARAGG